MSDRYRIVRAKNFGMTFWHIYRGDEFIARFELKREAISWIMQEEMQS